jgi:hypothetical protein
VVGGGDAGWSVVFFAGAAPGVADVVVGALVFAAGPRVGFRLQGRW